jgi:hypothetical protein
MMVRILSKPAWIRLLWAAGILLVDAKLSQTITGFKSFLLKPFDPFFRKNGVTVLPIKVTGTRAQPEFGLEFHRKKGEKNTAGD